MQWIEIMGPHGIGKTTLLRAYRKFAKLSKHPIRRIHFVESADKLNINRPTTWGLPQHWSEFLYTVENLYRMSFDDHNPDYKRRRNFCGVALRMSAIEESNDPWLGCMDSLGAEGMRLSFVLRDPVQIRSYFATMPVSVGVVMLEADPCVIIDRNRKRKSTDFSSLVVKGIRACEIATEALSDRTRLLRLDATPPIEDNVHAIAKFARSLQ